MGETVRTHVVLPKRLVDEIDALVGKRKRSEFIAAELERTLRRQCLIAAIGNLRSAPSIEVPGWETLESTVEWVRKQRDERSERERRLEETWYSNGAGDSPP